MTVLPDPAPFAELARATLDRRDWDTYHAFATVTLTATGLHRRTIAPIDPAINPDEYPTLMAAVAQRDLKEDPPPYAYLMEFEAYGVLEPPASASPGEKAQFERDTEAYTYHTRPDAQELASVWIADINGRIWSATKYRDSGLVEENFYPETAPPPLTGQFIRALLGIAHATGLLIYGTPGPWNMRN